MPLVGVQTRQLLVLARLYFVCPGRRAFGRLSECVDLFGKPLVLFSFGGIGGGFVFPPFGKTSLAKGDAFRLENEDVVAAGVQKCAVVRNEQKAALIFQIGGKPSPPRFVQMVGRLVYEKVRAVIRKKRREHEFCLFSAGKRGKGLFEGIFRESQAVHFPFQPP